MKSVNTDDKPADGEDAECWIDIGGVPFSRKELQSQKKDVLIGLLVDLSIERDEADKRALRDRELYGKLQDKLEDEQRAASAQLASHQEKAEKRADELRAEIASLSSVIARAMGYIDRVNETNEPREREVIISAPRRGPNFAETPLQRTSESLAERREWWRR